MKLDVDDEEGKVLLFGMETLKPMPAFTSVASGCFQKQVFVVLIRGGKRDHDGRRRRNLAAFNMRAFPVCRVFESHMDHFGS